MKITVHVLPVRKETLAVDLPEGGTVERLMRGLDMLPDAWIAVIGGEPVPIDRALEDGDVVKLISVVSGG
ncbi:MAG TPA: TGS domain-containing protein [Thermoplasmata archaeon]|nr:TGS domain-containing protein [Thermoplasmata archaeon]